MNEVFLIEVKKVFHQPGYYSMDDIWSLHNRGIELTKKIDTTITNYPDIGIRQLFHNILELKEIFNKENERYMVLAKQAKYNEIIEETLNAISSTLHDLLKLAFYYYAKNATYFIEEYKIHCKSLYNALKNLPQSELNFNNYPTPQQRHLRQEDYFRLLLFTGILKALEKPTAKETAELIKPEVLSKNQHILEKHKIYYLFMHYEVSEFNLQNARAKVQEYKSKNYSVDGLSPKIKSKIEEILTKINHD